MTINKTAIAVAWCDEHQKLLYGSRKEARVVARRHKGQHKSAYPCDPDKWYWHVGELHPLVVAGVKTRDEVKKRTP
jgi:hypothetical protein